MAAWTRHAPDADRYPSIQFLAALRTRDGLDVLPPQLSQYLLVALMSPLIFAGSLGLMEFIAETIFFVTHCITAKSCSVLNVFLDSLVSRPGLEPGSRDQKLSLVCPPRFTHPVD